MRCHTTKWKKRLAASTAMLAIMSSLPAWAEDKEFKLEEVVVTAMKRDQGLQDVPMSISVVGEKNLADRHLADLNDFLPSVPSVSFIDFGGGRNTIVVRGLSAQPQLEDKVVGTYFGEANISQLGNVSGGAAGSSDLKMIDIARVELLRGPQGTLYGAGTMGGTLRVIPNQPNLNSLEGSVEAGFGNTARFGGANSHQQAVLNVPIVNDRVAVRLVAYNFKDSGYVKNIAASDPAKVAAAEATGAIVIDKDHIGATDSTGWRLSALWKLSDDFKVTAMYASQDTYMDGRPEVNLGLGDYEQSRWEMPGRGSEFLSDKLSVANLTAEYNFGFATLVSSTSRINERSDTDRNFLGDFWEYNPSVVINSTNNTVESEELRLVSDSSKKFRYVLGYYYEKRHQHREDDTRWVGTVESNIFDPNGSNLLGSFDDNDRVKQNAVFGELSYDVTNKLTVTVGGRYFNYKRHFTETFPVHGVFNEGLPEPDVRDVSETSHTLKAGVNYRANDDVMIYAQWAQGFRLGKPIDPWPNSCDVNQDGLHDELGLPNNRQVNSDKTSNYEAGLKWTVQQRLQVNATAFYTDWTGMPVAFGRDSACGFGVTINGGKARTQGIELEGAYSASDSVRIDFGTSYVHAVLARDVEHVGVSGDRLPGSPKFSASLGITYSLELLGNPSFLRADYSYVGGYYGEVAEAGRKAGDYHMVNLNGAMTIKNNITASVYVKNLLNTKVLTWVDSFPPNASQMRPRVIGANLKYAF